MLIKILDREFEENHIKFGHKNFNKQIYDSYRDLLLSISERDTVLLPIKYIYNRMRFISQQELPEDLRKLGYIPPNERGNNENHKQQSPYNAKNYKNWHHD